MSVFEVSFRRQGGEEKGVYKMIFFWHAPIKNK